MKLYQSTNGNGVQITFENLTFASVFCPDGIDTNISLLVSSCSFQGLSHAISVENNALYIRDCIFGNMLTSQGPLIQSGITAISSMIYFTGHNIFINNNPAYGKGGALELYYSTFQISAPSSIKFINNTASIYGGAIYSSSDIVGGTQVRCFFQINDPNGTLLNPYISMYFDGNSAGYAGSAIYGGDIDDCWLDCDLIPNYNCSSSTSGMIFDSTSIFVSNSTSTSLISSDPYQLCPCENGQPHCEQDYVPGRINTYPGQKANISLMPAGQRNTFSPGTVLMLLPTFSSQVIDTSCAHFTIQFEGITNHTVLYSNPSLITNSAFLNSRFNMKTWLVVINVCPMEFPFNTATLYCDCDPEIKRYDITCDINLWLVHRKSQMWIGSVSTGSLSVYTYCPFDYCSPNDTDLDLMNQDEQCDNRRAGVLCGQCKTNLSMVFGSSYCDECSGNALRLIVLFAALGIGLIALLFMFNLTVSSGTINGLIIYANIIKLNETTFLNSNEASPIVKFCKVFISWLNLDFGIQTCFYNGFNSYVKTWLRLIFPLYLLCLISVIVFVSRYSQTVSKLCRINIVPVLATLIWLIYSSLSKTAVTIFQYASLDNSPLVWLYDGNVEYLGSKHVALFVGGLLIVIFMTPYTILLAFLPFFNGLNVQMFEGSHDCLCFIIRGVRILCLLPRCYNYLTSIALDTHNVPPAVAETRFDWGKCGATEWAGWYRVNQVKGFEVVHSNDHLVIGSTGALGAATFDIQTMARNIPFWSIFVPGICAKSISDGKVIKHYIRPATIRSPRKMMDSVLIVDVGVRDRATVLQVLPSESETLYVEWDPFQCLNHKLDIINNI